MGDAGREERGRPEPHHVAGAEDDLHAVLTIRREEPRLVLAREHAADGPPVEHPLTPVVAEPVENDVAGEHPDHAHREREPPPEDLCARQEAGEHDRHLLGHRQPEAGPEEHQV